MNFNLSQKFSAFLVMSTMASVSFAAPAYDCTTNRSFDPALQELRSGNIRPDLVADRLELFSCLQDFVKDVTKEGWKLKPLTVSLEKIVYGDEGHDQTYVVAIPMTKVNRGGPLWEVRKFHYENHFDQERLFEVQATNPGQ